LRQLATDMRSLATLYFEMGGIVDHQAFVTKVDRVRLGGADPNDPRAQWAPEHYLLRPVRAGYCTLAYLLDRASLADIEILNDALDVEEHNRALALTAPLAASPCEQKPKLADRAWPLLEKILDDPQQIPRRGRGRMRVIAQIVHRQLLNAGHIYKRSLVERAIRPDVREWMSQHPHE